VTINVSFYSYFKELTGTPLASQTLPEGSTLRELCEQLAARFPKWGALRASTLIAVGVEYQGRDYVLKPGDEVSFFPPVQGG
jgi:molybdopterin converting factor small subunit